MSVDHDMRMGEARRLAEVILGSERWLRKPTVPEVMPLVQKLYARHAAGCCLHVMLDDHNVEDGIAAYCVIDAGRGWCEAPSECRELAALLLRMSVTQRGKLARGKYR